MHNELRLDYVSKINHNLTLFVGQIRYRGENNTIFISVSLLERPLGLI